TDHWLSPLSIRAPANFDGIRVDNLTQSEAIDLIEKMIATRRHHRMVVVNASKLVLAERDERLRRVLQTSDLVTADGMSVAWASRFSRKFGGDLVDRVTGIDTFTDLCQRAAERGWRVYLLGAAPGVAEKAAVSLQTRFPNLIITGCSHGFFPEPESPVVAATIASTQADVLFVAMGSPKQEFWMAEFGPLTQTAFCLGVGGSFDHVAGNIKRAPRWMQRAGLEWFHRFALEPRRLWRRYLIGNFQFLLYLLRLLQAR
ncbi:MAG TPA: WecB/TagA/CpsF family glycosyltransferase, partial [Acidobacteriota bacterium]|nr:WecB/TagA/CpsF family glycosyltransferase [Acidobacteriota bacterium]